MQEIFIDLWKSAARFDPSIASETTFVAMIARRRLIDRGRRKMRRPEVPQIPETVVDGRERADETDLTEQRVIAQQAFDQLRPEQQQVLTLAIYQGYSHEQIATATGMPLGTVKTHARRGLIKIRKILADQGVLSQEELDRTLQESDAPRTRRRGEAPEGDTGSDSGRDSGPDAVT